ncbi:MAG: endonuclease III [Armatimonadetes bacterium]|nr:endonuclease III [Armatimonadota bacterium]
MSKISRIRELLDVCHGRKEWVGRLPVLDELVLTILSQNTTAKNCDEAFARLRASFSTWDDVRQAGWEEIAEAIKVGGLANRKAPRIKRILEEIRDKQGNLDLEWIADLPDEQALEYLLEFDGVGRKTAACTLMFALNRPVLPVDTHVHRVAERLGLIGKASADTAHDLLRELVPPGDVYSFHMNMVTHGRRVCHAIKPDCPSCILKKECSYFAERTRTGR